MAGLDEETDVGVHERDFHGNVFPVWENGSPIGTVSLDEAENIIPSNDAQIEVRTGVHAAEQIQSLPSTVQTR